jgi:hypothetical protein
MTDFLTEQEEEYVTLREQVQRCIKHEVEDVGLYDTAVTREDAQNVFENISSLVWAS